MSTLEIPLLRESRAFAARLVAAAARAGESSYQAQRRANWSYRYSDSFYAAEVAAFQNAPEAYLAGQTVVAPTLPDVYTQRLRPRQLLVALLKVLAHWAFLLSGKLADRSLRAAGVATYRKCYVDDIELVFDTTQQGVVRAVYPFPLNLGRQWRYLRFLRQQGHRFKLAGLPYLPQDLLHLLWRRDVRAYRRMESRAQILHAQQIVQLGVRLVQLSDEFDIGSLDFARRLARTQVHVVNSAHGVGKYLPVHAYREFHVLTHKQCEYYHAVRPCTYALRTLNDRNPAPAGRARQTDDGIRVRLVWLSQTFVAAGDVIADNEVELTRRLSAALADSVGVTLYYKAHPNSTALQAPPGFVPLTDLADVNGRPETLFASFFSTCQIDPAFKGRKVLVSGRWIFPQIAFDDSAVVLDASGLEALVRQMASGSAEVTV